MPGRSDLSAQRQELIGRARRSLYRLNRRPELLQQLKDATNELLRAELTSVEASREQGEDPGDGPLWRLPYKDD